MIFLAAYMLKMVDTALGIYLFIVFIYVLCGWFVQNSRAGWYVFLQEICEPTLIFIRRITRGRLVIEGFDLSPMLLFVAIYIIRYFIGLIIASFF